MSELKYQKLLQFNERLKQEDELPRIKVSEASKALLTFVTSTPDPLTQPTRPEFADNQFTKKPKALQLKLSRLRPILKALLVEPPKSPESRKEIEKGKFVLNGKTEHANKDFIKDSLLLSDLLNINELRAASLYKHALTCQDYDRPPLDVAIREYHRQRQLMLDSIELMLKGSTHPAVPEHSRALFLEHLREIYGLEADGSSTGLSIGGAAKAGSLNSIMLDHLSSLRSAATALKDDSVIPGFVTGSSLKSQGATEEIISSRLECLARDRWYLASLYYFSIRFGYCKTKDIIQLTELLRDFDYSDFVWLTLVLALLSALEFKEGEDEGPKAPDFADRLQLLKTVGGIVYGPTARWSLKAVQELVGVQFSLHVKQLKARYQQLEQELALSESIDSRLERGLENLPFSFATDRIISRLAFLELAAEAGEPDSELYGEACAALQRMVELFFKRMGRVVRSLKNKAEDAEAVKNSNAGPSFYEETQISPFESLLVLASTIYIDRPDSGIQFWKDTELIKFLRFMMDVRSGNLLTYFLELLASVATGPRCAQAAASFLSNEKARLSWDSLFRSLDLTAKSLVAHPEAAMHPTEIALQRAFLRLLKQVVRFSSVARISLHSNPSFQAINSLFLLLNCRVPIELKAALFETIAAFCVPIDGGLAASEIVYFVWNQLENAQVLPRPPNAGYQYGAVSRPALGRNEGIRYDLEQIESQSQMYPETTGFLQLLCALFKATGPLSPSQIRDSPAFAQSQLMSTSHYVEFVIEDVFLKVHNRQFISPEEKWRMVELCLRIFDFCLANFEISYREYLLIVGDSDLVENQNGASKVDASAVQDVTTHPAFPILCRIFSGSTLIRRIFDIVSNDVEVLNENGKKCPPFAVSIRLSLRIILRALKTQNYFLEVVDLHRLSVAKAPPSMTGLDQLLAFYKSAVVRIALLMNCSIDDEIPLLVANVLTLLSESQTFSGVDKAPGAYGKLNRLVALLSSSEESNKIVSGFVHRLQLEAPENTSDVNMFLNVSEAVSYSGLHTESPSDPDLPYLLFEGSASAASETGFGLVNQIRLAILELLIVNTMPSRSYPSVAHYLLGYNLTKGLSEVEILDPQAPNGRVGCLHVILEQLRFGLPQSENESSGFELDAQVPLYESHPRLAEKCLQLLYQLCSSTETASTTLRYLRSTEDFVYRQLQAFPVNNVEAAETSSEALANSVSRKIARSKLHHRAWLLKLIALELHMTYLSGQRSQAQKLLDLLYISPVTSGQNTDVLDEFGTFRPGQNFEQPLTKMLEVLNAIDFKLNGRTRNRQSLNLSTSLAADVDLSRCQRLDEYGLFTYDIRAAHALLKSRQRLNEKQGGISLASDRLRIKSELAAVLSELLARNIQIESLGARLHCLKGWCDIVRITLSRPFELLPSELREEKIHELLTNIFPKVNAADTAPDFVEVMSDVSVALLWRLRDDRLYQSVIQAALTMTESARQGPRLPVDSLQKVILKGILDGILSTGSSSNLRANHYAALTNFFDYTKLDDIDVNETSLPSADMDATFTSNVSFSVARESRGPSYRSGLVLGNLYMINSYGDRLLDAVCKDASDGAVYLKTTAFTVLESLCALSSNEKPNRTISFLSRRNYLGDFIRTLVQLEDPAIQSLLKTDSVLNQALSSLLLSIDQHKTAGLKLNDLFRLPVDEINTV
ncbi:hypothetical protein HDU96_003994 [Phlyctochytrium bullatum]|nr:hypothetical protein HDU96_003994 [Phlyctochytrium bullatum]